MTYLGDNIRWLRKRAEMTQEELARKTGKKSFTAIQHWETGRTEPSQKTLAVICDLFGVSLDEIVNTDLQATAGRQKRSAVKIPVLGRISAGIPADAIEDIIDYEEIPEELARTGDFFGLKISGDCMMPLLPDGCIVIFRRQDCADSGDIVAALIDGSEGSCKVFKRYDIGIALVPLNEAFKPRFFPLQECDRVAIIGKAVEMRRKL